MLLVASGCGDGSDDETQATVSEATTAATTTGSTPTKAEYIERADEICTAARGELEPLREEADAADQRGDFDALAEAIEQFVVIAERQLDELDALVEPVGDEEEIDAYLAGALETVNFLRSEGQAVANRNQQAAVALAQQAEASAERARRAASSYGFQVCGASG